MPFDIGSTTPITALAAIAASAADPPRASTCAPACEASVWFVATIPWRVITIERACARPAHKHFVCDASINAASIAHLTQTPMASPFYSENRGQPARFQGLRTGETAGPTCYGFDTARYLTTVKLRKVTVSAVLLASLPRKPITSGEVRYRSRSRLPRRAPASSPSSRGPTVHRPSALRRWRVRQHTHPPRPRYAKRSPCCPSGPRR